VNGREAGIGIRSARSRNNVVTDVKGLMTGYWQTLNLQLRRLLLCITRFRSKFA
jgi:L-aminopeptidase/D-esterase-like protein